MKRVDLTGQRFSRLIVIEKSGHREGRRQVMWLCQCDCGKTKRIASTYLLSGKSRSCGCIRVERIRSLRPKTLGGLCAANRRAYGIWKKMIARCEDPSSASFKYYGGRGISVCNDWHEFSAFLSDMGNPPDGRSLDRINNGGNYERTNCRWATAKEQANNKRQRRSA